jgi:predicted molibdopterin-dependent oxidoreductase YjgC
MSSISITVNGQSLSVESGQTVAAVLMSHGFLSWRTTRKTGELRGVYCGIGSCFDCLVTINNQPNIRACIDVVRDGDVVEVADDH